MKKILIFSHDPGGANAVIPLVKPLMARGYDVALWGKDHAIKKYKAAGLQGQDIMDLLDQENVGGLKDFLSLQGPDLIITATSAEDYCEKYLWKAAEELGIISFAILDQWLNYGIRFSNYPHSQTKEFLKKKEIVYLPSRIFLMDELARQDAIEDGLPANRLFITGQPHLQVLMEKKHAPKAEIVSIRNSLGVGKNDVLIVFASEPLTEIHGTKMTSFGFNEQTILKELLFELQEFAQEVQQKTVLVIRPHPRELKGKFDHLKDPASQSLKIIVSSDHEADLLIEAADCICGISSMFLLESVLFGKPIISIQIGLTGRSQFVLDRNNMVKSALNRDQLGKMLRRIVIDKEFKQSSLSFIKDPIAKIIAQVDECFEHLPLSFPRERDFKPDTRSSSRTLAGTRRRSGSNLKKE